MWRKLIEFVVVFCFIANGATAARILAIVSTESYSHQIFFQPLWKALVQRGHDLTLITSVPIKRRGDEFFENLHQIDIGFVRQQWLKYYDNIQEDPSLMNSLRNVIDGLTETAITQLEHPPIAQLIRNESEHFDLLMIEGVIPIMFGFAHRFPNASVIAMTSMSASNMVHEMYGNGVHALLYPDIFAPYVTEQTFLQRLSIVGYEIGLRFLFHWYLTPIHTNLAHKYFGKNCPPFHALYEKIALLFMNVNPMLSNSRPLLHDVIPIGGGMHLKEPEQLPQEIQEFLDKADHGAIFMSFGTNVNTQKIPYKVFLEAFQKLPYSILWKDNNASIIINKNEKIKIMSWLPQQDVLRHRNVRAFITQGGLQSVEEAFMINVPIVAIPVFIDQTHNAKIIEERGLGVYLDINGLTARNIANAVREVVENEKYRNRMKQFADTIKDAPMTPLEKAVWWTEYTLRHNKTEFHKKKRKLPIYQYYYLDIIAFLISLLIIIYSLLKYCIKFLNTKMKLKTN